MAFALIVLPVVGILRLSCYLLECAAAGAIARGQSLPHRRLVWVPLVRHLFLGHVADRCAEGTHRRWYSILLPLSALLQLAFLPLRMRLLWVLSTLPAEALDMLRRNATVSMLALIAALLYHACALLVLYRILLRYKPELALYWTVLCIALPFLKPVFLYVVGDMRPEDPAADELQLPDTPELQALSQAYRQFREEADNRAKQ